MPVNPTYPGVYVQELPSGNQTIVGVSTSVAAFIDYFYRGPMNTAVQVNNMGDVDRIFGGLNEKSAASFGLMQFFRNGGQTAWVVRVAANGPAPGNLPPTAAGLTLLDGLRTGTPAGAAQLIVNANDPGEWGDNVMVVVDHDTGPPPDATTRLFNLTATEYDSTQIATNPVTARNLSLNPLLASYAPKVVGTTAGIPVLVTPAVPATGAPALTLPAANGFTGVAISTFPPALTGEETMAVTVNTGAAVTLTFPAGTTFTKATTALLLQDALRAAGAAAASAQPNADAAQLTTASVKVLDVFNATTLAPIGSRITILLAPTGGPADFATAGSVVTIAAGTGDLAKNLGLINGDTPENVFTNAQRYILGQDFANSASSAPVVGFSGVEPGVPELVGKPGPRTGMFALDAVDVFNILCIPRMRALDGAKAEALLADTLPYCEKRFAFMIVDLPSVFDTNPIGWSGLTNVRSPNAAIYYPAVQLFNPLTLRTDDFAPSGTLAGVYAATDAHRGVWKAPAGIERSLLGVVGLNEIVSDASNAVFYARRLNCLRSFPAIGTVSWGARTFAYPNADWSYIPIRRLALYIELSIKRGLDFAVFEPNADPLWRSITSTVTAFMQTLFLQQAFAGTKPSEAYYVACDKSTTSQGDIDRGIVNVMVGYAPLKPAEFVFVVIQQITAKAS